VTGEFVGFVDGDAEGADEVGEDDGLFDGLCVTGDTVGFVEGDADGAAKVGEDDGLCDGL